MPTRNSHEIIDISETVVVIFAFIKKGATKTTAMQNVLFHQPNFVFLHFFSSEADVYYTLKLCLVNAFFLRLHAIF